MTYVGFAERAGGGIMRYIVCVWEGRGGDIKKKLSALRAIGMLIASHRWHPYRYRTGSSGCSLKMSFRASRDRHLIGTSSVAAAAVLYR